MDENCWSRSIEGGMLEDPAYHPPEEIYLWTVCPKKAPDKPEKLSLEFKSGVPVALNGRKLPGYELIQDLNVSVPGNMGLVVMIWLKTGFSG